MPTALLSVLVAVYCRDDTSASHAHGPCFLGRGGTVRPPITVYNFPFPPPRASKICRECYVLDNPATSYRLGGKLRAGLDRTKIASVGPMASDELKSYGLRTDIYPANDAFFMKPLISAMAASLKATSATLQTPIWKSSGGSID